MPWATCLRACRKMSQVRRWCAPLPGSNYEIKRFERANQILFNSRIKVNLRMVENHALLPVPGDRWNVAHPVVWGADGYGWQHDHRRAGGIQQLPAAAFCACAAAHLAGQRRPGKRLQVPNVHLRCWIHHSRLNSHPDKPVLPTLTGQVEFRQVSFQYLGEKHKRTAKHFPHRQTQPDRRPDWHNRLGEDQPGQPDPTLL